MRTPFLFLLVSIVLGILLSDLFTLYYPIYIGTSILLFILIVIYQKLHPHLTQTFILTLMLCLLSISTGIYLRGIQIEYKISTARYMQELSTVKVILTEYKGLKGRNELWTARVSENTSHDTYYIHLYLDSSAVFHKHEIILIPIKEQWEFCTEDKNLWMLNSNIIAQGFPKHYLKSQTKYQPNWIIQYSERLQQYTIDIIHTYIKDPDAAAIAISMILGQRTEINPLLQNAYKNTGTIHILAVSGMHVALLHQALIFLTAFSGNHRKTKVTKNILSFFILWFYALLTGFSASVVRAAAMFSLVLIASSLEKKDKGLNNLCAASFILLCYDPNWLYDFGFLLSVTAVAGIFIFTPTLDSDKTSTIKKFFQKAAGVSIAAQIGTLPISIYLSRSFPVYFLLANMILIPISSLALYLGLTLLLTHHIPILNSLNGVLLEYTLITMNYGALYISKLPGGLIHLYYFNTTCASWTGGVIFTWALFLHYRKKVLLFTTLIIIFSLTLYLSVMEFTKYNTQPKILKHNYQGQAMTFKLKGRTLYIKHEGSETPPYNWLSRKLNLKDGSVCQLVYLPPSNK